MSLRPTPIEREVTCEFCGRTWMRVFKRYEPAPKRCGPRCNAAKPAIERFWRYAHPEPNSGCWLWGAALNDLGYGIFHAEGERTAHRASWRLHRGEIPDALHVLHRCDNRACVNPAHLFLGTHADNVRDMWSKGRGPRRQGEAVASSKLAEDDVVAIRSMYRSGARQVDIATAFGVAQTTISSIVRRQRWRHVEAT